LDRFKNSKASTRTPQIIETINSIQESMEESFEPQIIEIKENITEKKKIN